MSKENDLIDRVAAGSRAQQERTALAESFARTKAEYIQAWEGSDARDTDGRERMWIAIKVLERVETHLRQMANDGKVAEKELEALRALAKKAA